MVKRPEKAINLFHIQWCTSTQAIIRRINQLANSLTQLWLLHLCEYWPTLGRVDRHTTYLVLSYNLWSLSYNWSCDLEQHLRKHDLIYKNRITIFLIVHIISTKYIVRSTHCSTKLTLGIQTGNASGDQQHHTRCRLAARCQQWSRRKACQQVLRKDPHRLEV